MALSAASSHGQNARVSKPATSFWTGADLSFLPYYESQNVTYSDEVDAADLLTIAHRNGWNMVRVRLWVEPTNDPKYQVSDLANVTKLAKRVKAAGFGLLLDLHYSDSWADPGQQTKPAAWRDLPFADLERKVESYSREVVAHLAANGAAPDIVQIGNEVKNGLLFGSGLHGATAQLGGGFWEEDKGGFERAAALMAAGARGARAGAPQTPPQIMLHLPDGQDTAFIQWFFERLQSSNATLQAPFEFDWIGLSYYPAEPWDKTKGYDAWHLSHLAATMNWLAQTYHKPILVVETNYLRDGQPRDDVPGAPEFDFTPDGQATFYRALIQNVRDVPDALGRGVLLWEPDTLGWQAAFDDKGRALPGVAALGQPVQPGIN